MWYNASWQYRVAITIDHTKVPSDLTDYPVYVSLANLPAGFHSHVKTDGGDIRVTKADGETEVPRELVFYDDSADTGELFFKADGTLSSSVDTVFYIYYGNAGASNPAADATYGRENVWKSTYKAVFHLQEAVNNTSGGYKDSTVNHNNGTGFSMAISAPQGKLAGKGQEFDGSVDGIELTGESVNTLLSASTGTVTAWALTDITGDAVSQPYLSRWIWGDLAGYIGAGIANVSGTDRVRAYNYSGGNGQGQKTYSVDTWMHIAWRHAGGTLYLYKDTSVDSGSSGDTEFTTGTLYLGFGYASGSSPYWNGKIDEVRFANTDLGADWITAEYNNTNSPSTFYAVGAETENTVTTALTKSLKYSVAAEKSVTKSLRYVVVNNAAAITKSLRYTVTDTPSAITKSLHYLVVQSPSAVTKSLTYKVTDFSSITKSLRYCVTAEAAVTKSLRYVVLATAAAITKSLQYEVQTNTAVTKSLRYAVTSEHAVTKSLRYVVEATAAAITKSLTYSVTAEEAVTKSLKYSVTAEHRITKSMRYRLSIEATPVKIMKSLAYHIDLGSAALTKSLKYSVTANASVTKSLTYAILGNPFSLDDQANFTLEPAFQREPHFYRM